MVSGKAKWVAIALAVALCSVSGCASPPRLGQAGRPITFSNIPVPAPAAVQEGRADVGGAQLHYWDTGGTGEVIVLLHAATGHAGAWGYQQPALAAAGYRVIGYSRRGHHGSDLGSPTSRGTAAGDLARLLDHLKVDRFHAVGVAAGGIYATDFAISHPQRLRSLVIAGSIVAIGDAEYMKQSTGLRPKEFNDLPSEFRELSPSYRASNPEGVARWLEIERANAITPATAPATRQPPVNQITLAALEKLAMPVLLMTGDADLYTPPVLLAKMAARFPNAVTVVIEGSGHSPQWERPDAFNDTVLQFLRASRHSSRS